MVNVLWMSIVSYRLQLPMMLLLTIAPRIFAEVPLRRWFLANKRRPIKYCVLVEITGSSWIGRVLNRLRYYCEYLLFKLKDTRTISLSLTIWPSNKLTWNTEWHMLVESIEIIYTDPASLVKLSANKQVIHFRRGTLTNRDTPTKLHSQI